MFEVHSRQRSDRIGPVSVRATRRLWVRGLVALAIVAGPTVAAVSSASASSTTLYVSMRGTDANNNCQTKSSPCATLDYAQSQLASGDTIDVGPGLYNGTMYAAGASNYPAACVPFTIEGSTWGPFNVTTLIPASATAPIFSASRCYMAIDHLNVDGQSGTALATGYGGGITVTDSTIFNSTVAMSVDGPNGSVGAVDSTLSSNAVAIEATGGGNASLEDSTVSLNGVAGDLLLGGGLYVYASTIANNGVGLEGLAPSGSVGIAATILGHNHGHNCAFSSGAATDYGYNIDQDGTCAFTAAADSQSGVNPRLGALSWNGGSTLTMVPQWGSPAINAIAVAATTFPDVEGSLTLCPGPTGMDQRGVTRPQGPACDIGAVEVRAGSGGILTVKETARHRSRR